MDFPRVELGFSWSRGLPNKKLACYNATGIYCDLFIRVIWTRIQTDTFGLDKGRQYLERACKVRYQLQLQWENAVCNCLDPEIAQRRIYPQMGWGIALSWARNPWWVFLGANPVIHCSWTRRGAGRRRNRDVFLRVPFKGIKFASAFLTRLVWKPSARLGFPPSEALLRQRSPWPLRGWSLRAVAGGNDPPGAERLPPGEAERAIG